MKTTYDNQEIIQEMNNLIHFSCTENNQQLEKFQEALIKKYFAAVEVKIDKPNQEIHLKLMVKKAQYANVIVNYKNFEEFLKSCLEDDLGNLSFYQNMLMFYNISGSFSKVMYELE
ncbi:DnaA ATPase domain-containing protein [Mesonia aestuariivivens]|uniref:Uncharacterized protein n=1 Tax=Mesonia aestuariivivens TaxID=2796128 RepID=A0ABS6W3M2_9FLAO|nr:DnaA/Hda family protein [Mesonia aestuariivivens]MBW2962467.1 hypothetical protein [Mesonia aestuariivivens]